MATDKKKASTHTKPTTNPTRKTSPSSKTRKTGSKAKGSAKKAAKDEETVTRKEIIQFAISTILILLGIFLTVAYVSYMFTGQDDQVFITTQGERQATNWMGNLGAWASNQMIDEHFGVASILIPIFLVATGIRIMGICKVRLWKWFINCGILMLWFCMCGGMIDQAEVLPHTHISLGGEIGNTHYRWLNERLGGFSVIVLIVCALAYLTYLSTETIRIIKLSIQKPVDFVQSRLTTSSESETDNGDDADNAPEEEADVMADNATEETPLIIEPDASETAAEEEQSNGSERDTATTIEFEMPINDSQDKKLNEKTLFDGKDMELKLVTPEPEEAEPTHIGADTEPTEEPAEEPKTIEQDGMIVKQGDELEEAHPDETGALEPYDPKLDLENYHYPTLDLLKRYEVTNKVDMEEQQANKNQILTVLSNFGVEISSIKATVGPTITLYEITPAPGVRISKIRNLEDDIALSLSALGIRIIAPIPGKGTIGIEVPNARPQMVSMESIINSRKFQECDYELPMAIGKTITNDVFLVDLAKMPHLLVAGATGQGKSVGLNAIITSLLYKKHPAELKIVMVDPKKVEFSVYNPIVNHFLAQVEGNEDTEEPIICDVTKVIQTLKSLCVEMDTRYDLLKKARARNVKEYNEKFKNRQLNPNNGHKFMPYIVVIIDEFGDLIMTAGKEIEMPIARIAQLARAVGIHMIIATQRPTTNIITGTIKANFPARMAFKVSSMIDSRTILDRAGANQLVGKGDMLFLSGNEPVRVQCAFVDTPEVEAINNYISQQQGYVCPFPLPPVPMDGEEGGGVNDVDMNNLDPMFEEVARMVVYENSGSTSMIQRKFSIGYNRAGRLMDQLEKAGIVGPAKGSKPREVLCVNDDDLQFKLDNLK